MRISVIFLRMISSTPVLWYFHFRKHLKKQLPKNFLELLYPLLHCPEPGCFHLQSLLFAELPKPNEIYDYAKYSSPNWLLNKKDEPIVVDNDNDEDDKSNKKSNLNFIL